MKRFRFGLLSVFRFCFFSLPVPASGFKKQKTVSACRVYFVIQCSSRTFVLVEQVSAQKTPTNSPDKTYTSLQVVTPRTFERPPAIESPGVCPLQIDEEPITKTLITSSAVEISPEKTEVTTHCEKALLAAPEIIGTSNAPCTKSMDPSISGLTQDFFLDPHTPSTSHIPSSLLGQFAQQDGKFYFQSSYLSKFSA